MLRRSIPTPLCQVAECPDLMSDGCLRDEQGQLLFLSLWGRDTAIQELLARLTLVPDEEQHLASLTLINEFSSKISISVGDIDRLEKRTTRTVPNTLFGPLIHLWLLDKRCIAPDKSNGISLAIFPRDVGNRAQRLWALTQATCPLPLLDHWRDCVLPLLRSRGMLTELTPSVGDFEGYRLALDVPALTLGLGDLIQRDVLTVTASMPEPLRNVA